MVGRAGVGAAQAADVAGEIVRVDAQVPAQLLILALAGIDRELRAPVVEPAKAAERVALPQADLGARDRRLEAGLGFAQREFGALAGVDVEQHAGDAGRPVGRIPMRDPSAAQGPAPAAAARPQAVLDLVERGRAVQHRLVAHIQRRQVIRVHVAIPARRVLRADAGIDVELVAPVVPPKDFITGEVEFPEGTVHALQRVQQAQPRTVRRRCGRGGLRADGVGTRVHAARLRLIAARSSAVAVRIAAGAPPPA